MSGRAPRTSRAEGPGPAWDPLRELSGLKDRLNRLFESALRRGGSTDAEGFSGWSPAADLREDKDRFLLTVELPGIARSDIHLRLEGRTLTLSGERPVARETRGADHLRVERSYGPFSRTVHLPASVDETGVEARLRQGVLEVRLPKSARERAAQVKIRVA